MTTQSSNPRLGINVLERLVNDDQRAPRVEDLLADPDFRTAFPSLYGALVEDSEFASSLNTSVSVAKQTSRALPLSTDSTSRPIQKVTVDHPISQATSSIANKEGLSNRQRIVTESLMTDVPVPTRRTDYAHVSLLFKAVAWESISGKEEAFVSETKKQLCIAIPGLNTSELTCRPERVDNSVKAVVTIPNERVDQMRNLFSDRRFLAATPLLAQGEFSVIDKSDPQRVETLTGSKQTRQDTSVEMLKRLDDLQQQYAQTQNRRSLLSFFHQTMEATDEVKERAKRIALVGRPPIPAQDQLADTSSLPFPYRGYPGVLSPRAKPIPEKDLSNQEELPQTGNVRPVPPPAHLVFAKQGLDITLQHFTSTAQQMLSSNAEVGRMITEAEEVREARRLVEAGLVNPSTLDVWLQSASQKHEQGRQLDELKMQQVIEEERNNSIERENSMKYLKKIFAIATGDVDVEKQLSGENEPMKPEELTKIKQKLRKDLLESRQSKIKGADSTARFTVTVESAQNVPQTLLLGGHADSYVLIRVISITGATVNEVQTRTAVGSAEPEWSESLYFEVSEFPAPPVSVEILLYGYNSVGRDTVLAQSKIDWDLWKRSAKGGSVSCWVLKCEVLENTDIPLNLRIDAGEDFSPRKVRYAQPVADLNSDIITRFPDPLPVSQASQRRRYWRHVAEEAEDQMEDDQAIGISIAQ